MIVLPSHDMQPWAKIEFRRFYEYARLAINKDELEKELHKYLSEYNLEIDNLKLYNYEDMEEEMDE